MRAAAVGPCADRDCRTTGGWIKEGETAPFRQRGLCLRCWWQHFRRGTLDQFPRHTGARKLQPTWLIRQRREEAIAMRVAAHEGGGISRNAALREGENNVLRRIANAERFAAAYLRGRRAA